MSQLLNNLAESFSRCFNPQQSTTDANTTSPPTKHVELHNDEWDKLFSSPKKSQSKKRDFEMSYGDVVLKAREVAHAEPARKTRARKGDIFRARNTDTKSDEKSGKGVAGFLRDNAQYLCFANPIGDSVCGGTPNELRVPKINPAVPLAKMNSQEGSFQEEDSHGNPTETSTQYFDRKHGVNKSKGQPMPLFSEFRIDCLDWTRDDTDENEKVVTKEIQTQSNLIPAFEAKCKSTPDRKTQIEKVFINTPPSIDPAMPDAIRLSGSHSTQDSSAHFLSTRSRSNSSRGSFNMKSTPKKGTPGRKVNRRNYSPLK